MVDLSAQAHPDHSLPTVQANGPVTIVQLRKDPEVIAFVRQANESLRALGYTEHGQRHAQQFQMRDFKVVRT